ncbi:MAG: FAD-dependent oxidoreductase, partial [Candidatus Nucleicultricaceae bacterium]
MTLSFGLDFKDLYTLDGIQTIDRVFLTFVGEQNPSLLEQLEGARRNPNFDAATESSLILSLAPLLDDFLRHLFFLEEKKTLQDLSLLYKIKRQFVQRILLKRVCDGSLDEDLLREKMTAFLGQTFDEIVFAEKIHNLLEAGSSLDEERLDFLALYAKWAEKTKEGQSFHKDDILFKTPKPLQFDHLVPFEEMQGQGVLKKYAPETQARDGFHCLDEGLTSKEAFDAASYCVKCHPQGKDSCSKGMRDADGHRKTNPLGNALTGCPLKQKISEMMVMYEQGYTLAALSIVMIDNPLLAMTGYRICNDCMKACIFQKQEPVDVPGVESALLKDALHLPYGFEMYSLLTRWNPLKFMNFIATPSQSKSVLVVGLGPAGIALSYYLLRAGFRVVGIDGSKIERLSERWVGDQRVPLSFDPVVQVTDLFENLEDRTIQGFGGVMEYGITVRWDKNLLTIMQLILERHPHFRLYDGVRFGGTLGLEEARSLGFDHIAFCVGAGEPKQPPIPGIFAKGIRFASDFLMSLHLTGAYKKESLVNTDIELPLVVVGAGLTAVDAATEALAYYPRLVERFYETYQTLALKMGEARVQGCWNEEEQQRALRYIEHAKALIQERARAKRAGCVPDFLPLLNHWGGVTLVCRTPINQTQSYKLNHEELSAAMRLGVRVVDNISSEAFLMDTKGQVRALKATHQGEVVE